MAGSSLSLMAFHLALGGKKRMHFSPCGIWAVSDDKRWRWAITDGGALSFGLGTAAWIDGVSSQVPN